MKWKNRQFGELEFTDDLVLTFPDGIIGFETCRRFVLINDEDSQPFRWLVSIEHEDLSFPLLNPQIVLPGYSAGKWQNDGSTVLVVASLGKEIEDATVNLRSPIVIANNERTAQQIILDEERYDFRHPLFAASNPPVKG
ncbi:MAG TPA: flagellar assembly protein FliW [Bacteroidota bacterium]|nr:flagellar assembly protein FliW [Bacteroidota bacterium]